MRGEFSGVWSETWREIWAPLMGQPFGRANEGLVEDVFCELYRELAKALRMPTDEEAAVLVLEDAVTLRELFQGAARRSTDQNLAGEAVEKAFNGSEVAEEAAAEERKRRIVVALSDLLKKPAEPLVAAQIRDVVRDPAKVAGARRRAIERTINDLEKSRAAFLGTKADDLAGEPAIAGFLESAYGVLEQYEEPGDDSLTNSYFNLLAAFIHKFSLRYDLRRPCTLCPTLPGVFASLVRDLRSLTSQDPHLDALMKDYEDAVRDLRFGCTDGRIRTCIGKQFMLLEGIGSATPGVSKGTLGDMCDQIDSWPHPTIKEALKKLYGFASDYPGIRHGKHAKGALRAIEMRDMVSMSILLTGFTPYLESRLSADAIFGGSVSHARPIPPVAVLASGPAGPSNTGKLRGLLSRIAFWCGER